MGKVRAKEAPRALESLREAYVVTHGNRTETEVVPWVMSQ